MLATTLESCTALTATCNKYALGRSLPKSSVNDSRRVGWATVRLSERVIEASSFWWNDLVMALRRFLPVGASVTL